MQRGKKNHCSPISTKFEKLFTKSQTWETVEPHYNHGVEYYAAVKKYKHISHKDSCSGVQDGTEGGKKAKGISMLYSLLRQGNACELKCAHTYLYTCYLCQRSSSLALNGRLEQKECFSSD